MGRACGTYRKKRHAHWLWWGKLKERDYLEDLGVDRRIILKLIVKKWDRKPWTELGWFRIGINGGLLSAQQ
jgi:hypothetical protein